MNNNTSLIWNIVLTLAVAVLFFLHFSNKPEAGAVTADGQVVPGRRTVYVQVDSLLTNYDFFKETKKELEDRIYRYFDEINKEPVPYKWTYKMDTIDLSKEDIDSIVYEVVNAKAASAENKNKKAPKPISRKRKSIQN